MFDRPSGGERVALVHIDFRRVPESADLEEFKGLALAADAQIIEVITGAREAPVAKTFIGLGKLEEIKQLIEAQDIQLVIFNHELSPGQERNLEKALCARVLDRTGLILDIFAMRARTFEGKLQVELAQLEHLSTRLVRGWTHLERQKGGIGLRGPGETQLETDRRLLRARISAIQRRLKKVREGREIGRRAREKNHVPTVSLVGYTNAGKSTLFNHLTGAHVLVADQLFATLDPTLRTVLLPGFGKVVLADTVGFVRQLPHKLVDAFRATLEETQKADLLLQIVDASDPQNADIQLIVNNILKEIGADSVPQIVVMNKIDRLQRPADIEKDGTGRAFRVWVSAAKDEGLELLKEAILTALSDEILEGYVDCGPESGALRSALYEYQVVLDEKPLEAGGWCLKVKLAENLLEQLSARFQTKMVLKK